MKKLVYLLICVFVITGSSWAKIAPGYVESIIGDGKLVNLSTQKDLSVGDPVGYEEEILSQGNIMAKIIINDTNGKSVVKIKPNTKIKIIKTQKNEKSGVFLFLGKLFASFSGKNGGQGFKVVTYNAIAGVEGTKFEVAYDDTAKRTMLTVFEGKIRFSLKKKGVPFLRKENYIMVTAGEIATIEKGKIIGKYANPDLINKIFTDWEEKEVLVAKKAKEETMQEKELITEGDKTLYLGLKNIITASAPPIKAQVTINGASILNGKKLILRKGAPLELNNLENDIYTIAIYRNGVKIEKEIDLSNLEEETASFQVPVRCYIVRVKHLMYPSEEVFKNLKYAITYDGKKAIAKATKEFKNMAQETVVLCDNPFSGLYSTYLLLPEEVNSIRVDFYYGEKLLGKLDIDPQRKTQSWQLELPLQKK